jgi:hypothetical protein
MEPGRTDTNGRIDRWVWILIFGGMGLGAIGASLVRNGHVYGWGVVGVAVIDIVLGLVLIVVRSRRPDHAVDPSERLP